MNKVFSALVRRVVVVGLVLASGIMVDVHAQQSSMTDNALAACDNHNDCPLPGQSDCDCKKPAQSPSTKSQVAKNLRYRHYAFDYRAPKAPTGTGLACTTGCGGSFPTLPGLPSLELERVHYEDTQLPSSIGLNWSFTQDVWLVVYPPGTVASGRPTGVPGWQVLVAKPMETPIDFFVGVDGAGTGTFQDGKSGFFKSLQFFLTDGTLTPNPSLATSAVFTEWSGETWTFEMYTEAPGSVLGRPVKFADRNGNAIAHTWKYAVTDPAMTGSLRSKLRIRNAITDAYGRSARFTYDEAAQHSGQWVTTRIDLPNGQHLSYGYGNNQNPWKGVYDSLAQVTEADGVTVSTFSYAQDAAKNCVVWTVHDPVAEPQSRNKQVWFTDALWIDPANPQHQVGQIFGRVRQITDSNGDIAFQGTIINFPTVSGGTENRTYYYSQGKLMAVIHQGGDQATAIYERNPVADGQPFFLPTADWSGWTKTFDLVPGPGRLTPGAFTDANGHAESRTLDPQTSAVLATHYPDGSTEITNRNAFQQVTHQVDRAGRVTDTAFDAAGNRLSETRGSGTPDQGTWQWVYWTAADTDAHRGHPGQVRASIDARGNATEYFYYPSGDLYQVVEPADVAGASRATTTYVVDVAGRCTQVLDPANRLTQYGYDPLNRQISALYADGSTEAWTFATTGVDAGLLVTIQDRNGHQTTMAHDAAGHTVTTIRAAGTPAALVESTVFMPGNQTLPLAVVRGGDSTTFAYDLRLRKISESRFTHGSSMLTTQFVYDNANLLVGSVDPFGRRTALVYDVNDRLVRTVRELVAGGIPAGANPATLSRITSANPPYVIEETGYDASGLMTTRVDGRGITTQILYDAQARQHQVTEAVGTPEAATIVMTYDAQGNVIDRQNARQFHTAATYSGRNLLLTQTEAVGTPVAATTAWTYTPTKKVATVTDALLRTTINGYGVCCDRLTSITDAAGFITKFAYDSYGNRTSVTDANNNVTLMTYDARNRPSSVTNGANEATIITYTEDASVLPEAAGLGLGAGADGSAVITKDALQERTVEIRDGLGRVVRRVDPLNHQTTTVYDAPVLDAGVGLVATATSDPLGHTVTAYQDAAGRTRVVLDALGNRATAGFDAAGNRVTWRDANGVGMDCAFDARNRDVLCTDTAGAVTRKAYDANSNLVATTDALLKTETSAFDARDRKTATTDRVLATTVFAYDAVSNLVQITDAENGVTDYRYETRNLLDREVFPRGEAGRTARFYDYDPGRRLTSRAVAAVGAVPPAVAPATSERTSYLYDHANRLTTRGYADAKNDDFSYDQASRLIGATSTRYANHVSRSYDAASRLTGETLRFTGGDEAGISLPISYGYDDANRQTRITYPDGSAVTRGYDERNVLSNIWDAGVSVLARGATDLDAGGRVLRTQLGNGLTETRTYIPNDNLVASIVIPGVDSFAYTYDPLKRKTAEIDNQVTSQTQRFAYDDQSRLTDWKRTGVAPTDPIASTQTWTLSPVGDWKKTVIDGTAQNRKHDPVHELIDINGTALRYDAKGNLIQDDQGQRFAWDQENRLLRATNLKQKQGDEAAYFYDALGRRVKKSVTDKLPASSPAGIPPNPNKTVNTVYVSAGAQEVIEITGDLSAAPWLGGGDADPESPGVAPFDPVTGKGAVGSLLADPDAIRFNFQPTTTDTPDGWRADTGEKFAAQGTDGTFGWESMFFGFPPAPTPIDRDRIGRPLYDTLAFMTRSFFIPQQWSIALPNGSYPVVIMVGDASSRVHTDNLVVNGRLLKDPTPWDGKLMNGYEEGQFDAITAQVQVTNGKLTIQPAWLAGALFPRVNFIEIGKAGTSLDAATIARAKAAALKATQQTGKPKPKTPPVVKRNVWGTYVDELVSYTVQKPRHTPVRYFTHSNHLYSVAATTNTSGQVVERYSYNAYGVRTVKNSAGVTLAKSAVNQDRGFTSYKLDSETGLYFARSRMFSAKLGRFISRDPRYYIDGFSLYSAYFIPNSTDYSGTGDDDARNPGDDKMLSPNEIDELKKAGHDPHDIKDGYGDSKSDLYKDKKGNIYIKPKGGRGAGIPTGINIKEIYIESCPPPVPVIPHYAYPSCPTIALPPPEVQVGGYCTIILIVMIIFSPVGV